MFNLQIQCENFRKGQVVRDSRDGYVYVVINPNWEADGQLTLDILGDPTESLDGYFRRDYRYMEVIAENKDEYLGS